MEVIESDIEEAIARIQASWKKSVEAVLETAKLVVEYHSKSEGSRILKSVHDRMIINKGTIDQLLKIGKCKALYDPDVTDCLPNKTSVLYDLALLGDDKIKEHLDSKHVTPTLKLKVVKGWREPDIRKRKPRNLRRKDEEGRTDDLPRTDENTPKDELTGTGEETLADEGARKFVITIKDSDYETNRFDMDILLSCIRHKHEYLTLEEVGSP